MSGMERHVSSPKHLTHTQTHTDRRRRRRREEEEVTRCDGGFTADMCCRINGAATNMFLVGEK